MQVLVGIVKNDSLHERNREQVSAPVLTKLQTQQLQMNKIRKGRAVSSCVSSFKVFITERSLKGHYDLLASKVLVCQRYLSFD